MPKCKVKECNGEAYLDYPYCYECIDEMDNLPAEKDLSDIIRKDEETYGKEE